MNVKKKNFEEIIEITDNMYESNEFEKAIEILKESLEYFPEKVDEINNELIYFYRGSKEYDKCLELIDRELDKGNYLGLKWPSWGALRDMPQWDRVEKKNRALVEEATRLSSMKYKVFVPDNFDPDKNYPLCFILHGDTGNIEDFSSEWKPDSILKRGHIAVYIQSSTPTQPGYFDWSSDYEQSRKDIEECYNNITEKYNIDKNRVILSGFSGGSMAALTLVMRNTFPVQGLIALCPMKVIDCNEENIKKAADRDLKLVLMEGEESGEVPFHKELMDLSKKYSMEATYIINKDAGHNIPPNWDSILKRAIEFINN